jgi:hypothetical protein
MGVDNGRSPFYCEIVICVKESGLRLIRVGLDMKRIYTILLSLVFIFLFSLNTFAQKDDVEDILVVLPAQSIAKFVTRLLPYEINKGKNFSGSLWIKSIKNIKIKKNKLSFSSHIYGKDIIYNMKIGKQVSSIELGNVNPLNDWEISFRFDADKKVFYIKPHLKNQVVTKNASHKEILINTLFKVLSDIEYPIDLREINPITTEFLGNFMTINFEVSDIYAAHNELTVKFRPIPHISDKDKTPVNKTTLKK